jgi:hypothetical protein
MFWVVLLFFGDKVPTDRPVKISDPTIRFVQESWHGAPCFFLRTREGWPEGLTPAVLFLESRFFLEHPSGTDPALRDTTSDLIDLRFPFLVNRLNPLKRFFKSAGGASKTELP